jgi:hypothetical protein
MSGAIEKAKRVEVEACLKVARDALERVAYGHSRNERDTASSALDKMHQLGRKQPLQGLVGHEPRK